MQIELFLELDMEIMRKADRTEAAEDNSEVLRVNQVKVKQANLSSVFSCEMPGVVIAYLALIPGPRSNKYMTLSDRIRERWKYLINT